jgi:hypothetical protein
LLVAPADARAQDAPPAKAAAQPKKDPPASKGAPSDGSPGASEETIVERYPPSSVRWKIVISGIAVTGVAYAGAAMMGGLWDGIPAGDMLYIPVAGPWIALAESGCTESEDPDGEGDCAALLGLRAALYVVDGLMQIGGLGLIAESIFMTTESSDLSQPNTVLLPAPIVTPTMVGFGLSGTF